MDLTGPNVFEEYSKLIYHGRSPLSIAFAHDVNLFCCSIRLLSGRPRISENTYESRRNLSFKLILPALSPTRRSRAAVAHEAACDPGPREMSGNVSIDAILTVERAFDGDMRNALLIQALPRLLKEHSSGEYLRPCARGGARSRSQTFKQHRSARAIERCRARRSGFDTPSEASDLFWCRAVARGRQKSSRADGIAARKRLLTAI